MAWNSTTKDDKSKNKTGGSRSGIPTGSGGGGGVNTIDTQTKIEGNLTAGGDIRIDGTLIGNLICRAKLIIGPKGHIEGDVECEMATIEGKFKGNLTVKQDLTLQATSDVTGDVKAGKMAVLGGAAVKGTCTVPYARSSSDSVAKDAEIAPSNPLKV